MSNSNNKDKEREILYKEVYEDLFNKKMEDAMDEVDLGFLTNIVMFFKSLFSDTTLEEERLKRQKIEKEGKVPKVKQSEVMARVDAIIKRKELIEQRKKEIEEKKQQQKEKNKKKKKKKKKKLKKRNKKNKK